MATKGCVFVLFAIIAAKATNTSAPGSTVEHVRTEVLRNSGDNGHTTFNDYLSGFAGRYRNLPSRGSMERLRRSMDQQNNSLSDVRNLVGKLTPKDCGEIYRSSKGVMDSGVYTIYPRQSGGNSNYHARFPVFCRVEDGRAWTVMQRRQDGSVDFYNRTWEDYRRGFGNLWREFWFGNDKIHLLTNQGSNTINPHSSCFMHNMGGFWVRRPDTFNPNGFYYGNTGSDCPKLSRTKLPGILGFGFVEMRILESTDSI
ncbi:hypothetical protein Bbelb_179770 [Branchiostoma belcheri]|nr:hypothetical protein Bbelb_179770 [Branchiostoma belcheri]